MSPRKGKQRHIPQRTCVGCREVLSKRELTRIVRSTDGVKIDPTGKAPGRGAYLHNQKSCWEASLKGSLARALKLELSNHEREDLENYLMEHLDEWES